MLSCKKDNINELKSSLFQNEIYKKSNSEIKIKYLDSLVIVSRKISNDSILTSFLFDLSSEYYYNNESKKSLDVCKRILDISTVTNDTLSIAKAYSYIGDSYEISQKDSAYYFYQKSEKLYRILNNKGYVGKMLFKKAYILFYEGNYIESEVQVSRSLFYLKNSNDKEMLFTAYSLLALNFEKLEEYKDALKYQIKAKSLLKDIEGNNSNLEKKYLCSIVSSINISNIYEKTFKYDKAIQELEFVLNSKLKQKWLLGYVSALGNLGYSKMKQGKIKGADKYFKEALLIAREKDFKNSILYQLKNLGEFYSIVRDTIKSTYYLKQSCQLAEKLKMGEETKSTLKLLSKIDFRNAAIYDKRYIALNDSLSKVQRISRNKYARIEYETSVVEDENKLLSTKNTFILLISIVLIIILLSVIIYRYIKNQKREIEFRKAQQKAEEEIFELLKEYQLKLSIAKELEQNRISKELHDSVMNRLYGARMQLGILNDSDLKEVKEKRLIYVDLLQEIEQEIRTISHDLHSDIIDNQFDYMSLLSNLILMQNEIGTTIFSIEVDGKIDWDIFDSLVKITIFRIVQESILNVTKHAKAKFCYVSVSLDKNNLILNIKDDGVGFDLNISKQGIGLKNIQERAKTIKADIEIISILNEGTSIKTKVKIDNL